MLLELSLTSFAIIDRAVVRPGPGLTVLTGETGAGKSILIEALLAIMGGRVSTDLIRAGADEATVEALFEIKAAGPARALLTDAGIDLAEGQLVISRELSRKGRNVCRMNGRLVTAQLCRDVAFCLVDVCGQLEHQSLTRGEEQLVVLDRYAGPVALATREAVGGLFADWQSLRHEHQRLLLEARDRERRLDTLAWQIAEIDRVNPQPGEWDDLMAERERLAHAERLVAATESAFARIYDSPDVSAVDLVAKAAAELEDVCAHDQQLAVIAQELRDCLYRLQGVGRDLARYRDGIAVAPERLAEVEERLDSWRSLRKKYGETAEQIRQYREQAASEREEICAIDDRLSGLEGRIQRVRSGLIEQALALRDLRHRAASEWQAAVSGELADLGLGGARFEVVLEPDPVPTDDGLDQWLSEHGLDRCKIVFSANPDEPPRQLGRVASGGELSRLMLAVKAALADRDGMPTIIFDEIDAGIGGGTVAAVAERLVAVSRSRQVVCVTHQPLIAAVAADHVQVSKSVAGGVTTVAVQPLDGPEREAELARMLGGPELTSVTVAHARELLRRRRG